MSLPNAVKIVEVGPRDGLQNESGFFATQNKIQLINQLGKTGLQNIEVTSFVSPKWIPQLADAEEVFTQIQKEPGVSYSAIIPNVQGLERALQANVNQFAVLCAASETFSQKNIHCSIAESLTKIKTLIEKTTPQKFAIRGYISCAFGCPFEGEIKPQVVLALAKQLLVLGCNEIALGDTIGVSTPRQTQNLIKLLAQEIPIQQVAIHFHDTYGQALANIYACLELGISTIDSAIGGLGGCPYAKGASGNVATEDVLYMLQGLGVNTGIDIDAMIFISQWLTTLTHNPVRSKVTQAKIGKQSGRVL